MRDNTANSYLFGDNGSGLVGSLGGNFGELLELLGAQLANVSEENDEHELNPVEGLARF